MLAFVMLWAYFNVSQLIIICPGNLPEEIPWYLERLHGPVGAGRRRACSSATSRCRSRCCSRAT